jgi:hypothetical protein
MANVVLIRDPARNLYNRKENTMTDQDKGLVRQSGEVLRRSPLIVLILDRSGSMSTRRLATVEAFNEFRRGQASEGPATFTLVAFSTEVDGLSQPRPIEQVPELTAETYQPDGSTALYDAVGLTIVRLEGMLGKMRVKPGGILIGIITDGQENASKEFKDPAKIRELIRRKMDEGWRFELIGMGINAQEVGREMGGEELSRHSASVAGGREGAEESMSSFTGSVLDFRREQKRHQTGSKDSSKEV